MPAQASAKPNGNAPETVECDIPGRRRFIIWNSEFEVDEKYEPIKAIGKGAYGVVCSARCGDEKVAIKKVGNCFANEIDARRALREVTLLRQLKHDNIIALRDIMAPSAPAGGEAFQDVYLVYELMDTDLHQILRSKQPLSDEHFQYFLYQLLRGLKYIHSGGVLHRDLKPGNLLLDASCELKICDFGLARAMATGDAAAGAGSGLDMTEYVVTRWYRAPELLVNSDVYTPAVDIWSVGCILGEMLGRKPLFPGKDYLDQLRLIACVLGMPTDADLAFIHHERARDYIRSKFADFKAADMHKLFPGANPQALDIMSKLLQFNPERRMTVEEALAHPYLAALHDSGNEPACERRVDVAFEAEELSGAQVRRYMVTEIREHYGRT